MPLSRRSAFSAGDRRFVVAGLVLTKGAEEAVLLGVEDGAAGPDCSENGHPVDRGMLGTGVAEGASRCSYARAYKTVSSKIIGCWRAMSVRSGFPNPAMNN
jgi:hypothetical protein